MNKIKTILIHWLGGYTKEYIDFIEKQNLNRVLKLKHQCDYEYVRGRYDAYAAIRTMFGCRFGDFSDSDTLKELKRIASEDYDYWKRIMNNKKNS